MLQRRMIAGLSVFCVAASLLRADDPPKPGEWVLIHVGFALSKIDEAEAAAAMAFLEGIGQAYEDEIKALQESLIE